MVHYIQYLIEAHTLRLSVVGGAGGGKNSNTYIKIECDRWGGGREKFKYIQYTMLFNDNSR